MTESASTIQMLGAGAFGAIIGWFTYFVNRYRKAEVQLSDLATMVGVLGGGAVLALFPAKTDLFGAYGMGIFVGFFGYLLVLAVLVACSNDYDFHWFLDGRRKALKPGWIIPTEIAPTVHPMDGREEGAVVT